MTHELKILHDYFMDIMFEGKNFEIRKDDRDFHVGDKLILKEWNPYQSRYTGNYIEAKIDYVHHGNGEYGVAEGYCILALTDIECVINGRSE